jgi:hypothetical protein
MKKEHKRMLMIGAAVVGVVLIVAVAASAMKTPVETPFATPAAPPPVAPPGTPYVAPPVAPPAPAPPAPPPAEPEVLEQTFADVASTVLRRAGVDDRINPALSTKNGGMLPILDVRGDYEPLMPFEDARCDENGRWNQSSRQQGIRLGLIRDQMKRRVVVQ